MRNNNTAKTVQQEDFDAIFGSELKFHLDSGKDFKSSEVQAWRAAGRAESRAMAPDESRIQGHLTTTTRAERQTRGGQTADLDSIHRAIEAVQATLDASKSGTHRDRALIAFDALADRGRANAGRREKRKMILRGWKKCFRILIEKFDADSCPTSSAKYAEALLKIEAELAFLGKTMHGTMHTDNIVSLLPYHVERVGMDSVIERYKALLAHYADAYRDAALAAVDTGKFEMPELITGRDIGTGFDLTADKLKRYFPHNSYGIRACDRDAINAERKAKGLKVRKRPKPKSREDIRREAGEQRDIEEMIEHYGYARETVLGWRGSKPKPGSDLYGEKFLDMVELMHDQKRRGIDPKGEASDLEPDLRDALKAHYNVGDAALRQWKARNQLGAKIARYRRETALTLVA